MEEIGIVNRYAHGPAPTGRLLEELLVYLRNSMSVDAYAYNLGYPIEYKNVLHRLYTDWCFYRRAYRWMRRDYHKLFVVMTDPPLLPVIAALSGVRYVAWVQDVYPDLAVKAGYLPEWLAIPIRKAMIWALKKAEKVVVIGQCMKRHLQTWGVESEVIPNWVDGKKWPFTEVHDGTRAYLGHAGVVHGFPGETVSGLSEDVFRKECQRTLTHIVTLREDMLGLSVPSKVYTALACGRKIEWHGPTNSEAYWVAYASGALFTRTKLKDIRTFFERNCDRPIQTKKWWTLLSQLSSASSSRQS